jgi:hypothetical protein
VHSRSARSLLWKGSRVHLSMRREFFRESSSTICLNQQHRSLAALICGSWLSGWGRWIGGSTPGLICACPIEPADGASPGFRTIILRLDIDRSIDDEKLNFATRMVIGRWYERFGSHLTSLTPRLLFSFNETMLAANLRRDKMIVALDQGVFRKRCKKPHHFTLGEVFTSSAHGPSPPIVVPRCSC